ncbi:Gfo/Idh/MocA family oxidoreductase [Actinomyces sp. MRS3W]|uniref:Gfo/Idh/MocA family oxidoreductase n=1 Tax=Actinomyces sp. MRS3W TaxID=2800796 RepID=UPI0028FD788B|nr:Gfo/Idh/MocA family oxidoreductase [Actinomyces sp. MRS3W]MDU0348219.1 Gfo/Idh/MocA family oxidoreductase [Actinomyces sp. MRS3W]
MTHSPTPPARLALIGAGRIGTHHATAIAHDVHTAELVAVVDPRFEVAQNLAGPLGARAEADASGVLTDPDIDAVVVTTPAALHRDLIVDAARAGKHIFTEKPITTELAEAAECVAAAESAGVVLQVGFNRRFAPGFMAARRAVDDGRVGTPQLLRSLTRDPGPYGGDPARTPLWTIFLETLIHDFDTLRWLNPGAEVDSVTAHADALIRPDARGDGFLDTAVVNLHFTNGAFATAEASFSATYGYDVRGEVFGDGGMATAGSGRTSDMDYYGPSGVAYDTSRADTDLLHTAYVGEFLAFVEAIRGGSPAIPTGEDGVKALQIARAAIVSIQQSRTVHLKEVTR